MSADFKSGQIVRPEMILTDLDGTLVDSVPDLAFCVDGMLEKLGKPPCGETKVRMWVGNGVERLVHRALTGRLEGEAPADEFERALSVFRKLYAANTAVRSRLYPGVREGLDYLDAQNYLLGCVTNKAECFTLPLLEHFGMRQAFSIVLAGDSLAKKKPDPLPLLHAAEYFGVAPKDSLMIGDSVSDIKAARSAGFQVICVSYGYNHGIDISTQEPDLVVDSLTEVREFL